MTVRDRVLCELTCATDFLSVADLAMATRSDTTMVRRALVTLQREGLADFRREGRATIWYGGLPHTPQEKDMR